MKVLEMSVGPIVGHTTSTSVRLWGRKAEEGLENNPGTNQLGCVRYREESSANFDGLTFFKFNSQLDFTAMVELSGLQPDAPYRYQMGIIETDNPDNPPGPDELDWDGFPEGKFRTFSAEPEKQIQFFAGSCRYIGKTPGNPSPETSGVQYWFTHKRKADRPFGKIIDQLKKGTGNSRQCADFILMMGDQIYADNLEVLNKLPFLINDFTFEEFCERHRVSFSQPNIKKVMSQLPTYMILDDHDIKNNWKRDNLFHPNPVKRKKYNDLFNNAIKAYEVYQGQHGPNRPLASYNYSFDHGCARFFAMDVRTERMKSNAVMLSVAQLDCFKNWLSEEGAEEKVKFVVSPVPFFPDTMKLKSFFLGSPGDIWAGFHKQRLEILQFIEEREISKVVFLSGDSHVSFVAQLTKEGSDEKSRKFSVHTINASAFHWPVPGIQKSWINWKKLKPTGKNSDSGPYRVKLLSNFYKRDSFARVSAGPDNFSVNFYKSSNGSMMKGINCRSYKSDKN